ncbi:hypothetical protein DTO013E5_7915 [Penicillium roqueforti]|uniref:Genomic scaffold, ProqFM164S04 n=1 Tax=Penicillium roqueforti (strain FM164) TaxID=1365484 RepID=W6QHG1_PENRF|nr:hypothetical protein DTO012A1_4062 [Penicillium roqueforti]CDM35416.1 unnamed protein product [Penicillium roqueforti FM164]KAI2774070.1 hypothetical protein DTO012A8_1379 [Penicillium roqueforti]KAI3161704.1 hypothetical protein DTO046C5_6221 [Penicillium roqueforti]KAI3186474.1 hypothetical protein DTO032C6_4523 [Penicillium roqueforti]
MHLWKALILTYAHLALSQAAACSAGGCGSAPACVLTETCTTATFVSPSTTTITTCVPTPTCAGVYSSCEFGTPNNQCCSGYCAANKCRSTDDRWPSCSEDNGPCVVDEHCCYGNICTNGICSRT